LAIETNTYEKYNALTRRWYFFASLILLQLMPPFTSKGFNFDAIYEIVNTTLTQALFFSCRGFYPAFQGITISVILLLIIFRCKARIVFSIYVGISYLLFALLQLTAITPRYGLSVVSSGVIMFGLVAVVWFWEVFSGFNNFSVHRQPVWKYAVIVPAIIAFWMPIDLGTCKLDLSLAHFVTSGSALTFCMMTPVYLAILIFFYPMVNMVVLRVTSAVGMIIAIYNMPNIFIPDVMWLGLLHLPLSFLSLLGLILSMRRTRDNILIHRTS